MRLSGGKGRGSVEENAGALGRTFSKTITISLSHTISCGRVSLVRDASSICISSSLVHRPCNKPMTCASS